MTDASLRRARKTDLAQAANPAAQIRPPSAAGSRADAAASDAPHRRAAAAALTAAPARAGLLAAAEIRICAASQPESKRSTGTGAALPGGAVGSASPEANCQPRQTGPASLLVLPARSQGSLPALTAPPGSRPSAAEPGRRPAPRARQRPRQRAARQAAPDCRGGITRPHPAVPARCHAPRRH